MKNIITLIFIISLLVLYQPKTLSYEEFNGKYGYGDIGENKHNIKISKDEEILFIMDFSGSMNKKMGYTPKSFLAIDAIREILDEIGAETKIGLRIFGVTDKPTVERYGNKVYINKENLCTASSLVLPIARYNSNNISDKLSKYVPRGATPIGYSLRQAIQNDFDPASEIKHIILITDGNENCGDNPCMFIKNLMQYRNDYKIDVIGITVDENAYSQLKCISNAGKGDYYSVETPTDFKIKFTQAVNSTNSYAPKDNPVTIHQKPKEIIDRTLYKNFSFEFYN